MFCRHLQQGAMTSWICIYLSVIELFFVLSSAGEYKKDYSEEVSFQRWGSNGRLISPRLRHFHPQLPTNKDDASDTLDMDYRDHNRRSLDGIKFSANSKDLKNSRNKTVCRDETQIHNDTEEEICPEFAKVIENVTQAVGRDAKLECIVDHLGRFRVAWLRIETQTVLTMHRHVISRNYRITLSHSEHRVYVLHINNVQEDDRGSYMCQVNTVPMLFQIVYLDVVVPPEIIEEKTSSDMFVREGSDVTLKCAAKGRPVPKLSWRREDYKPVVAGNWQSNNMHHNVSIHDGDELTVRKVSRLHMGAYLCIASNGVPPAMSRRIQLQVNFPPMIWIPNQLVGATLGQNVIVECHTEAHPDSINYWSRHESEIINHGDKFDIRLNSTTYKVHMTLTIRGVVHGDYGTYTCIARNFLGTTEGTIRLYEIHVPHPVKEPSTAKIQSLDGTSANPDVRKESEEKEELDDVPRDSKYPNISLEISEEEIVSGSFSWHPPLTIIIASISITIVNSCLHQLGT